MSKYFSYEPSIFLLSIFEYYDIDIKKISSYLHASALLIRALESPLVLKEIGLIRNFQSNSFSNQLFSIILTLVPTNGGSKGNWQFQNP